VRARVAAAFKTTGIPPADRHAAGLFEPATVEDADLVDSIEVADGRIAITFSPRADSAIAGQTLYLTPFETADLDVVWVCGNKAAGLGLKPLGFAAGGPELPRLPTAIDSRFLPPECR
jgi:pilin